MKVVVLVSDGVSLDASAARFECHVAKIEVARPRASAEAAVASLPGDVYVNGLALTHDGAACVAVAEVLEENLCAMSGCASQHLKYNRADALMIAHYAGLTVPAYAVISTVAATHAEVAQFNAYTFPVQLRGVDMMSDFAKTVDSYGELHSELATARAAGLPRCIVQEFVNGPRTIVRLWGADSAEAQGPDDANAIEAAKKLFGEATGSRGRISVEFVSVGDQLVVVDVAFNFPFLGPGAVADDLRKAVANVLRAQAPAHRVTFDPKQKGFHVTASRALSKGDVVFQDEGKPTPIVTKAHVERHWSSEDRETFKRYAWPIDSDGHVYGVWQNDPRTWRPINHSCDPNLVFAQPHSLNVVAARDIAAAEDLTLDYATFCDLTMEPFKCFCGSPSCRGEIMPEPATLAKYGAAAWHRKLPGAPQ